MITLFVFLVLVAIVLAIVALFLVSLPFLIIFSVLAAIFGFAYHTWWLWALLIVVWIAFGRRKA